MTADDLTLIIWAAVFAGIGVTVWFVVAALADHRHRTDKTLPIDRAQSRSQLMPPTTYDDYLPLTYPEHIQAEFARIKAEVLAEIDVALWQVDYDPNEENR